MVKQARFRRGVTRVVATALRMPKHAEIASKGSVARGIGGAEDADDRFAERGGQMKRAGVAGDDKRGLTRDRDEFGERGLQHRYTADTAEQKDKLVGDWFLAGPGVDDHAVSGLTKLTRDRSVALDGPALGAPACSGTDEDKGLRDAVASVSALASVGKRWEHDAAATLPRLRWLLRWPVRSRGLPASPRAR